MAEIDRRTEQAVTKPAQPRDVSAAAARGEPCSLREVRAVQKRIHELRDLAGIRRAVRVDHGYDVTGSSFEPAGERVPLSSASLPHYPDVGPQLAGNHYRVILRVPVHHDHLVDVRGQPRENVRQVFCFIQCRNDHGYAWPR
jgi:hypothetical protein